MAGPPLRCHTWLIITCTHAELQRARSGLMDAAVEEPVWLSWSHLTVTFTDKKGRQVQPLRGECCESAE